MPIYLEIDGDDCKPKAPFKFNYTQFKDESYIQMITKDWKTYVVHPGQSSSIFFCIQNEIIETEIN